MDGWMDWTCTERKTDDPREEWNDPRTHFLLSLEGLLLFADFRESLQVTDSDCLRESEERLQTLPQLWTSAEQGTVRNLTREELHEDQRLMAGLDESNRSVRD